MKKILFAVLALGLVLSCSKKDGEYTFHILTTGDCHGAWFSQNYVGEGTNPSLFAVKAAVDEFRAQYGKNRVVTIDGGDGLQGDEAAYYYNYVYTQEPHVYPEILAKVGYDAVIVGNHDIETGHGVYDRLKRDFKESKMKWLAGNAINEKTGKPYFGTSVILRRDGIKIAILGYTNPNIGEWLREELWSGIRFESLMPKVQEDVDRIIAKKHPDIVIVAAHSGIGAGDGKRLENQGLDLFNSLKGVDFVICAHDHKPVAMMNNDRILLDSGSKSQKLGHGTVTVKVEGGKIVSKEFKVAEVLDVDKNKVDAEAEFEFSPVIENVIEFVNKKAGVLTKDVETRDAYKGMSDYMNLVHYVCLKATGAQVCFSAPLTYNKLIPAGQLLYKDMSTIYPYENQLYKISMKGGEIVAFLEKSYDSWVQNPSEGHVLKITDKYDPRNDSKWSFVKIPYNLDSASGINYTVDVTKPYGERVAVASLADGTPFDLSADYSVAINSYRASGAGGLLPAAGIESVEGRVLDTYREIRNLIYAFIKDNKTWDPEAIAADPILGAWSFVPSDIADKAIAADMALLFE